MNLCKLTIEQREDIEQDKQRWALANKMANTKTADQIKRWLFNQADLSYSDDMAKRLRVCWKNKVK